MSFIDYDNIKAFVETSINNIASLSNTDAALVAAMANMLDGRNNPPSNMSTLQSYLQGKEDLVSSSSTIKDVSLLLAASMPSKNTIWKSQVFLSSGSFIVPENIAGNSVYITGCGGGGSGAAIITTSQRYCSGGASGFEVEKRQVIVSPGATVSVTVGAGGEARVVNGTNIAISGANGGSSSFGSLVIAGGDGGGSQNINRPPKGGRQASYMSATINAATGSIGSPSVFTVVGNSGISSINNGVAPDVFVIASDGADGMFGRGGIRKMEVDADSTAASVPANSGAGGGAAAIVLTSAATPYTATSAAGGAGRIIVEWQEFV